MGVLQPGLPSTVAVPQGDYLIVINLQDCSFKINLNPKNFQRYTHKPLPYTKVYNTNKKGLTLKEASKFNSILNK